jgi:hypothetical protein
LSASEFTRFKDLQNSNPANSFVLLILIQTFFALTRFSQALTPSEGALAPYLLLRARSVYP